MSRRLLSLIAILLFTSFSNAQEFAPRDAAAIKLALHKLNVLGSVLYIGAHPDDENTAFLATMANGRYYRAAYLSCTRGEGGQNLLGPEQGDMLGLIRTQELLAARRIDGAEQYFTRAIDFGFSKTTEETLRIWGKDSTLADVVWVIRNFRPDVIVTRFTPVLGGHGNHTASAALAEEAFRAAADPARFPDQLRFVRPWQAKRLVWNAFRFSANDPARPVPASVTIDLGAYSPLLGRSFTEIAGEGRSMHKSQGFGASQNRGEFINAFQHVLGDSARTDLFDGVNTTWSRIPHADSVAALLREADRAFDMERPSASIPLLMKALGALKALPSDPWIEYKMRQLTDVVAACAGIGIDLTTPQASAVPGASVPCELFTINRSPVLFQLMRVDLPFGAVDTLRSVLLEENIPVRRAYRIAIPSTEPISQPSWLLQPHGIGSYHVDDLRLVGQPENAPPVTVRVTLASPLGEIAFVVPLRQKVVDPVLGELHRPFTIVPPVVVDLEEPSVLFPNGSERPIVATVRAMAADEAGAVHLTLPDGWTSSPAGVPFAFRAPGEELRAAFRVRPNGNARSGVFTAEATVGSTVYDHGMQTASYSHIPPQVLFPPSSGKLLRIPLRTAGKTVGYIMGAGDEIPPAIRQMGYTVTLLTDNDLAESRLDRFDVIIAGIRAYNTRPALRVNQKRLMTYVKNGGTYIVQYMTPVRGEADDLGPYPFHISRDRVTEENAPVTIVRTNEPLMTAPNRITAADFDGWVQERGLYFADTWDAHYDSVLVCHDAGEPGRAGGLLCANYGRGVFVYCAYAFFRQLPAGVEGSYRIFANLLSLRGKR